MNFMHILMQCGRSVAFPGCLSRWGGDVKDGARSESVEEEVEGVVGAGVEVGGEEVAGGGDGGCGGGVDAGEVEMVQEVSGGGEADGVGAFGEVDELQCGRDDGAYGFGGEVGGCGYAYGCEFVEVEVAEGGQHGYAAGA